jgi:hypothetical protein
MSVEYRQIAEILTKGSIPLKDAASTLAAYKKGPKGLARKLIEWRIDSRKLKESDHKILSEVNELLEV